jgi:hypothetical protein
VGFGHAFLGVLLIATIGGGCGPSLGGPVDRWVAAQGGFAAEGETLRLRRVAQSLRATTGIPFTVAVLASPRPGAYAWPDGRVFVTRGLLALLDDSELTAAVAHELGHLQRETPAHPPASVHGHAHDDALKEECRADTAASALLRASGQDSAAVARMLRKLHASPVLSEDCRRSLALRLRRLESLPPASR